MEKTENAKRGERIRAIRNSLGLNQKDFGKVLGGLAISTISGYESGDSSPTPEVFIKIADLGSATLGWLIAGKDDQKENPDIVSCTTEPENEQAKARLIEAGQKSTTRNIHLRKIIEWMDHAFGENEEQSLFFYDDMKDRYPAFHDFMERKRPGRKNEQAKDMEHENGPLKKQNAS